MLGRSAGDGAWHSHQSTKAEEMEEGVDAALIRPACTPSTRRLPEPQDSKTGFRIRL